MQTTVPQLAQRMIDHYESETLTTLTDREKWLIKKSFYMGLQYGQRLLIEQDIRILLKNDIEY
ncbi:hypothetical protein ACN6KS_26980 [Paenibacillus nitricinens]|uniref:hypothetical protein n=1 Tax=Paenibacillus nitricinens TaxID=3367691 RepID=UPI003F87E511